jgi:hypothetical protein
MALGAQKKRYAPALALLAALVLLHVLSLTRDPDVFWHLRTGAEAVRTKSTLPIDTFSYSYEGAYWRHKDLLAAIVLYLGFARLGYAWFAVVKALAAAAMIAAYSAMPPPERRSPFVLLVTMGAVLDSFWLIERPYLFSMALFAVMLALVERAERRRARASAKGLARTFAPLIAVTFAWTWLHRFAFFGHAMVAWVALSSALALLGKNRPTLRILFGAPPRLRFVAAAFSAAALSPLCALANPSGRFAFTTGFESVSQMDKLRVFFEWKRVGPFELARAFPVMMALTTVAFVWAGARLAIALRRRDEHSPIRAWHALLLATLAVMTADSVRWFMYLAMAAALAVTCLLAEALADRSLPKGSLLAAGALFLVLLRLEQGDARVGVGEDESWSPKGAVAFARERGLTGRVANSYDFGGYLLWTMWPDVKVLVDGRHLQLYPIDFPLRCLEAEKHAAEFWPMRADGATWALGTNEPGKIAFGFLARDPAWALVYWSDTANVYVRKDAHPDLLPLAFRYVDPYDVAASIVRATGESKGDPATLAAIVREIQRMLDASPDATRPTIALAAFWQLLGPTHAAERDAALAHLLLVTHDAPEMVELARSIKGAPPR